MQGFQAWQKLSLSYSPRTMARAMMTMVEAVCPPKISQLQQFEVSVRAWEEKLRVLERDFEERVSTKLRMAILTSMLPPSLQDWVYQQGDALADYSGMLEKLRALVKNRLSAGTPNQVAAIDEYLQCGDCEEPEEWNEENAVGFTITCHKCGGIGRYARDCPSKGKGNG